MVTLLARELRLVSQPPGGRSHVIL